MKRGIRVTNHHAEEEERTVINPMFHNPYVDKMMIRNSLIQSDQLMKISQFNSIRFFIDLKLRINISDVRFGCFWRDLK